MALRILSYDIYPQLREAIPAEGARIADVGCGTGAWLLSLNKTVPASHELHGFDISASQFPPPASLPVNVHLHTANAMQPFPPQYHGTFDLVHLRLLVCALERDDWVTVARNVLQILKPGGHIQWDEPELDKFDRANRTASLRSNLKESTDGIASVLTTIATSVYVPVGHKLKNGWSTLGEDLQLAGFVGVQGNNIPSDRMPELAPAMTKVIVWAIKGVLMACVKKGVAGTPTVEEIEKMFEAAVKATESGFYYKFDLGVWMGRRPQ